MTYTTRAGDMWDSIAYEQLGSCDCTEKLINLNRRHIETFKFKAGVELELPTIEQTLKTTKLPPWRTS